jgi:hypothetical protein
MEKTKAGTYRKKRADTKMETIEKNYGKDFGVRSDMKLGNFLEKKGYNSLSELLKTKAPGKETRNANPKSNRK